MTFTFLSIFHDFPGKFIFPGFSMIFHDRGNPDGSAGFRGEPKGAGTHQKGLPTMFICLATCAACACHLILLSMRVCLQVLLIISVGRRKYFT